MPIAAEDDAQGTIYLVQASASERNCLAASLKDLNRRMIELPSAEALWATIDDNDPLCVIADVDLPGQSGLELLGELEGRCPAILIGMHGSIRGAVQALRNGAEAYFEKPVSSRALHETVAAIIGARSAPSEGPSGIRRDD